MNSYNLEALQCCLITSFIFMIPLKKRVHYEWRFLLCTGILFLIGPYVHCFHRASLCLGTAAFTADTFLQSASLYMINALFVLAIDLVPTTLIFRFCCELSISHSLYGAICAYLTQDLAYTFLAACFPWAAHRAVQDHIPGVLWLELIFMAGTYIWAWFMVAKRLLHNGNYQVNCMRMDALLISILVPRRILGSYVSSLLGTNDVRVARLFLLYESLIVVTLLMTQVQQSEKLLLKKIAETEKDLRIRQQRQYQLFRNSMDNINHKTHDLKRLLSAIQFEHDGSRKEELFNELNQALTIYDSQMNTGNDALDAILANAWLKCNNSKIQWTCMAEGSALSFLEPVDMFLLLGNALDNAIESASKVEEKEKRFIGVNIWSKEGASFIKIENYCENEPSFIDGLPQTSKENKTEHGYGMKSIQDVVNAYHGEMNISTEKHIFTLDIMLPCY